MWTRFFVDLHRQIVLKTKNKKGDDYPIKLIVVVAFHKKEKLTFLRYLRSRRKIFLFNTICRWSRINEKSGSDTISGSRSINKKPKRNGLSLDRIYFFVQRWQKLTFFIRKTFFLFPPPRNDDWFCLTRVRWENLFVLWTLPESIPQRVDFRRRDPLTLDKG